MPSAKNSSAAPLIKGYLPVRLSVPTVSLDGKGVDDTFFFVKEHYKAGSERNSSGTLTTLFVANVPCVPGIPPKILLRSLLGRYGQVSRVTVVENPRSANTETASSSSSWTTHAERPSFFDESISSSSGKFAHVVFSSSKEMRKTLRYLHNLMAGTNQGEHLAGLSLEKLEIEALVDEARQHIHTTHSEIDGEQGEEEDETQEESKLTGILAVAERYRMSCRRTVSSRSALMEECNTIMESFEEAEEANRRAREAASGEPDEDGFITVTYAASKSVGSKRELEQGVGGHNRRKAGTKRSRKKKGGAKELEDFYRFQMKESRKKSLQELRKRFEEDLAKVKKMTQERQYRPF